MIKIFYITRRGAHKMVCLPGLKEAADKLENLWKARIEAEARDEEGRIVGAVHFVDILTWFCEVPGNE